MSEDDRSGRLGLPYLLPAQAQKHVTHNEALQRLDALVQLVVAGFGATTPPADPAEGEVHALGVAPAGAWEGQGGMLAGRAGGDWFFVAPQPGWLAHDAGTGGWRVFRDDDWHPAVPELVARLGINTGADAVNRLAVAAPASLFTHDGAGHQLKLNKAVTGATASLLYQTDWSGRAETGLTGSDDFAIRVSDDGSGWTTALQVARTSGAVTLARGVLVGDGAAGAPGLRFAADPDTGLRRPGSNALNIVTGGTDRLKVNDNGAELAGLLTGTAVMQGVLDTTGGRLMPTRAHGLGDTDPRARANILSDWLATDTPTGFHTLGNDTETPNKPSGISGPGWGAEITVRTFSAMGTRFGWRGYRNATEFFMQKWDGDGWGHLLKFCNNRNIVGTVINDSGVPDGAIIERGGNANGSYVRLADGTQICWKSGGIGTDPVAFSDTPVDLGSNGRIGRWFNL